jgi:hypothetical protein
MDSTGQLLPIFFWNGEEDPTFLIMNILPSLSKISSVPIEELKERIATVAVKSIEEKYRSFEFAIEFEENGIFQLIHDKSDFFHQLATGDRIVLWLSLLAVIKKAANRDLIFILYHPFSRLDFMERVRISEFLKDNFGAGQLTIIDSKRDFESIKHV